VTHAAMVANAHHLASFEGGSPVWLGEKRIFSEESTVNNRVTRHYDIPEV